MSDPASEPLAPTSVAEPTPIVSDIPPSHPSPAVNPATVNGTCRPSDSEGSASTRPGSAAPSVPATPSHGPSPSAPSKPSPAATPAPANSHPAPQAQYRGQTLPLSHSARPAPAPLPQPLPAPRPVQSNNYQARPGQAAYQSSEPAAISYQRHPLQLGQPVQLQGYQLQSSRPLIVEPPRKRPSLGLAVAMPPAHSASSGFPSPTKDYASAFPKFSDDLSRNTLAIKQSVPEAVRQAVRDNWEKCLLGSEFHQAFVLNASMHHATPGVQNRAVHDFGAALVTNCKSELIGHFSARDIDDVADLILAKASNAFLDKALELRLATIDAKPLLNALARAERLGYDAQDLVEVSQGEHVIPNSHAAHISAHIGAGVAGQTAPSKGGRAAHPDELQCLKCYRTFEKQSHFHYHVTRSVCSKVPPTADGFRYACPKCGMGFTHTAGLHYHTQHLVCEGSTGASSEPRQSNLPATPVPLRSTTLPAQSNMTQTPSSQIAKPSAASVLPANRPGEVSTLGSSPAGDPYGHLTEEQMAALNAELLQAEQQYAGRFVEAEAIADPEKRRARLESLRNTFGTKQSMIRKKFGVRLRERRTRAEIQAERERMGRPGFRHEKGSQSPAPPPQQQRQQPSTASTSAWTAANKVVPAYPTDNSIPSLKRRRVDEAGEYNSPYPQYPQQQTGATTKVSEMAGGLGASAATAAIHDPTLPPPSTPSRTYQQSDARVEIHIPTTPPASKPPSTAASVSRGLNGIAPRDDSATPDVMEVDRVASPSAQLQEQDGDDIKIKADVEEEDDEPGPEVIDLEDDSDDDEDDGDIPASLPPSVRQSLASSQLGSSH